MKDDIVERLRVFKVGRGGAAVAMDEAADEIERLRGELQTVHGQLASMRVLMQGEINRLRVLQVRPRDDVMPGAFIARLK